MHLQKGIFFHFQIHPPQRSNLNHDYAQIYEFLAVFYYIFHFLVIYFQHAFYHMYNLIYHKEVHELLEYLYYQEFFPILFLIVDQKLNKHFQNKKYFFLMYKEHHI